MSMPKFALFNHHGKADAYLEALPAWNWFRHPEEQPRRVDFVLTDHAILARRAVLEAFMSRGTRLFFVYPHAARPNLVNDAADEWGGVTAHFVAAPGHVEIMRAYGYEKPLHVAGWHLCPQRAFAPRKAARKVLFAPIHPRCAEVDQKANREAFKRLFLLASQDEIELTVRFYSSLAESGLVMYPHENITYHKIDSLYPCWEQFDAADVVVAHQTFGYLAVARGVPAVFFATDLPTHLMTNPLRYARNWDKYQHLLAYPYDLLAVGDAIALLDYAARNEAAEWRTRMIGQDFDADAFCEIVESYL